MCTDFLFCCIVYNLKWYRRTFDGHLAFKKKKNEQPPFLNLNLTTIKTKTSSHDLTNCKFSLSGRLPSGIDPLCRWWPFQPSEVFGLGGGSGGSTGKAILPSSLSCCRCCRFASSFARKHYIIFHFILSDAIDRESIWPGGDGNAPGFDGTLAPLGGRGFGLTTPKRRLCWWMNNDNDRRLLDSLTIKLRKGLLK